MRDGERPVAAGSLARVLATPGASAREAGIDAALTLDPITVEGELLRRNLQETTPSVVEIPGEELDRRDHTGLYDVIERMPGVMPPSARRASASAASTSGGRTGPAPGFWSTPPSTA